MTQDDVLFGYRLQLFRLAAEVGVSKACRTMGVTARRFTAGRTRSSARGLRCCARASAAGRRCPISSRRSSSSRSWRSRWGTPAWDRRIAAQLARPEWGALIVSANGVYKTLVRHGLNTRVKRLALVAGHRAPYEPPREPEPEPHIQTTRPGELVGIDCFFVGRLHGTTGPVWQITACDTFSSFAWADLVVCPPSGPTVEHTSALARRVARELQQAGWQLERVLSDNGNEFGRRAFAERLPDGVAHTQIRSGRPQTNGHVERLHRTILEECWRPAFARFLQVRYTGLKRHLDSYLHTYNCHRAHTGRRTAGRCPADLVYGARKMEPR